jgi:hypothetical protein
VKRAGVADASAFAIVKFQGLISFLVVRKLMHDQYATIAENRHFIET